MHIGIYTRIKVFGRKFINYLNEIMSIEVKSIDTNQVKTELKKCPKIVRDYVKSLEDVYEMNRVSLNLAIVKLGLPSS